MKLEFFYTFSKKAQIWSFIKICPVGAELFYADGQTDMTKLIVAFRSLPTRLIKQIFFITDLHTNRQITDIKFIS
jgi:hypothetical protein